MFHHSLGTTTYVPVEFAPIRAGRDASPAPARTHSDAREIVGACESQPSAFDGMSQSPLHAVYGAPATTHGVGSERQRLLAEVVGESPDPPREPLSRGARVASALVAFAVVGCAVIGMLSLVGGAPLARLGAIGDTGWARELTPEEVELKERAEREAADATVVAVGNLAGLGETNMPAMGMVKHDLDEVAVKLGSTGSAPRRSSVRESETSPTGTYPTSPRSSSPIRFTSSASTARICASPSRSRTRRCSWTGKYTTRAIRRTASVWITTSALR